MSIKLSTMAPRIWDVLSESNRIIKTQPRLYFTLSLIFLLPLSLLSLFYQFILKHLQQQQPPTNPITIITSLILFILSSIFTFGAVTTITYTVYHAFFNRPIKLKEAIKSFFTSFFPLLATSTAAFAIAFFVFFIFTLLIGLVFFLIVYLGDIVLKNNSSSSSLIVFCSMVLMIVLILLVMYVGVNLSLVHVIVVVESCWGIEPLKRSWKLVKGMKRLVLSTFSLFRFLQSILMWISGYNWIMILVFSPILVVLLLYNIAAYTVIYIYCKENHGEGESADEEFRKEKDEANISLIS